MPTFKINWQDLIEKSKKLCKEQQCTSKQLAAHASVSPDIISKFEKGEEDIQLSDVLKILNALEALFQSSLEFQDEAIKNGGFMEFIAQNKKNESVCFKISRNTLNDFFSHEENFPLVFKEHKEEIHKIARLKYLYSRETSGPIRIDLADFQEHS